MEKNLKSSKLMITKLLGVLLVLQMVFFNSNIHADINVEPTALAMDPTATSMILYVFSGTGTMSRQATVVWTPKNTTYTKVNWKTSNSDVATVSPTGVITSVNPGFAIITGTSDYNAVLTSTVSINVYKKLSYASYSPTKQIILKDVTTSAYLPVPYPLDATITNVTYMSSNPNVAKVDSHTGLITTITGGTTIITAKYTSIDGSSKNAVLLVTVPIPTKSVILTKRTVNVNIGTKYATLAFKALPIEATDKTVSWSIDNTTFATVDKGVITPIAPGSTTLTIKSNYDNTILDTVSLNVYTALSSIKFNKSSVTVKVGEYNSSFGAIVNPSIATTVSSVVYSIRQSSKSVIAASVDSVTGIVYGLAPGTATITATITSGDIIKTATIAVTVPIPASSIAFNSTNKYTVAIDKTINLTAKVSPPNATTKTYRFKSSDYSIASVNGATGVVTGISAGTATITVTSTDGSFTDTKVITVTP